MIEAKAEEIKVQAEAREAEKAVVIEAKADHETDLEADLEALESVTPPPEDPGAHGGGRGR
jgi:hypothetical protein